MVADTHEPYEYKTKFIWYVGLTIDLDGKFTRWVRRDGRLQPVQKDVK